MFLMLLWVLITNAIIVAGVLFNNIKLQVYTHFTQVVVNDNVQLCLCDLQLRNAHFVTDIAFRYVGHIVFIDGVNTVQSIIIPFNYV